MKMFFNMQKMLKPFQHLSLLTAGSDPPRYQLNNMQMHTVVSKVQLEKFIFKNNFFPLPLFFPYPQYPQHSQIFVSNIGYDFELCVALNDLYKFE